MTPETFENRARAKEWLDDLSAERRGEMDRRRRNTAFVEALRQHHPERLQVQWTDRPIRRNSCRMSN